MHPEDDSARDFNGDGLKDTYFSCVDGTTYALFTGQEGAGYKAVP